MQIDAIVEPSEPFNRVPIDTRHLERSRELKLEDANAAPRETLQALRGVFELDRSVAHVVTKAEMAPDRRFGSCLVEYGQGTEAVNGS